MTRTALILATIALGSAAFAQTAVWRTADAQTNSFGPAGPTGNFLGQPPATQWTRWPERGSGVRMAGPRVLTEVSFSYLANFAEPPQGTENVVFRIYANDGAMVTGSNGTSLRAPGTLLYETSPIRVQLEDEVVRLPLPSVSVPADFTYTLSFQGGLLSIPPFDPNDPLTQNLAGARIAGNVTIGQPQGPTGVLWRRVFTGSGPSAWGGQERPGTFSYPVFTTTASFWSGPVERIAVPYDSETLDGRKAKDLELFPLGVGSGLDEIVVPLNIEGPDRTVRRLRVPLLAAYDAGSGTPVGFLRLYASNVLGSGALRVLWSSGPLALPVRVGDPVLRIPGAFALTADVPSLDLPTDERVFWAVQLQGLPLGATAGLTVHRTPFTPGFPPLDALLSDGSGQGVGASFLAEPIPPGPSQLWLAQLHVLGRAQVARVDRFAVLQGRVQSGNLASLREFDLDVLRVCRFIQAQPAPPVQVEFYGQAPVLNPRSLRLEVRSRTTVQGQFDGRVELFDFFAGRFDPVDVRIVPLGEDARTIVVEATGDVTRYISSAGLLRARATLTRTGPALNSELCQEFDYAQWILGDPQ